MFWNKSRTRLRVESDREQGANLNFAVREGPGGGDLKAEAWMTGNIQSRKSQGAEQAESPWVGPSLNSHQQEECPGAQAQFQGQKGTTTRGL